MKDWPLEKLAAWCRAHRIDVCVLFGSHATGKARPDSDVDIAVLAASQPELKRQWLRVYAQLEEVFGQAIDLVILDRDADPVLRLEVFQHGQPLFEARPGLFVEHRVLAVKLFDDTIPLRRWRDRALARRILNLKYVDKSKYVTPDL